MFTPRFAARLLACSALLPFAVAAGTAHAEDASAEDAPREIVVTGARDQGSGATKTDIPILQTPQPITVVDDELYLAQGAVSIGDTLNYVSGVTANPYGPDSRVDGALVRGINALQFRDGMRDIYDNYASIRADPYNFDQVELVRGPASVLFGQGALGGIVNLVSKRPEFTAAGEASLRYGSFDRKEALVDVTGPLGDTVAARLAVRVRDAGTQTDYVPDDRVMVAPSITFRPSPETELTLLGLYQEDDSGSTSQFLPLVGTLLPNPNGQLRHDLFVGKPGWDRYDGRLLQGTALFEQRFGDTARLNLKARYIDSDVTYFTHYPNSYSNPANPYLDADQRTIALYADGTVARMEIFSTDNNVQFDFATGAGIEHTLLAGIDYSFNSVRKVRGTALEVIDIYAIDYAALSDFGGGLPAPNAVSTDVDQDQIGIYLQDQIRFADRVSVVLGARRDWTSAQSMGGATQRDAATTFRAGIIGDITDSISPFASYTESFEPVAGANVYGDSFRPKTGRQFEAGVKIHPGQTALLTLTAYHIRESNRPVSVVVPDPENPDRTLTGQLQIGSATSKGLEAEGSASLPGDVNILANVSYNETVDKATGRQVDNVPKFNASAWMTKGFTLSDRVSLLLGGGVRHVGKNRSYGPAFVDGVVTPSFTLVDALAEIAFDRWSLRLNATNLFDKRYYSACLARGDCFMGSERNIMGTVSYRF